MLWTAFILGLFGGTHCAGMCGPIALAIPRKDTPFANVIHKSTYNLGRVATYGLLGVLAGILGEGFKVAGVQQGISVFIGSLLILSVILTRFKIKNVRLEGMLVSFTYRVKKYFSAYIKRRSLGSAFILGLINGLLPCGLVYVALAAAVSTGNLSSGTLYMVVFGIGTIPVMLSISLAGNLISGTIRQKIYKLVPVFVFVLGLLFILRGLHLGIPYVSPQMGSPKTHIAH